MSLIVAAHDASWFAPCVYLAPSPVREAMASRCCWLCLLSFGLLLEASTKGSSSSKKTVLFRELHSIVKRKEKSKRECERERMRAHSNSERISLESVARKAPHFQLRTGY